MVEDVLAEHLLLGRYEPGTTIVVDRDPDAGLDDPAPRSRGRPSRRLGRPWPGRQSRFVCQACGEAFLRWEGQCRALRRVEQPRRDRHPRAVARQRGRTGPRAVMGPAGAARRARRRSARPDVPRLPSGSASSTASSAAVSCPGRSSCSAANPGSASPRCCSRPRPGSFAATPASGCSTRPARSRRPRSACGPAASGCCDGAAASRVTILAEHEVGRIVESGARAPAGVLIVDSVQTATVDELDGPPAASARSASRPPADGLREGGGDRGHPGRPRDQGRLDRRAQDPRAPRRCGDQPTPRERSPRSCAPRATSRRR